MLFIATNNVQSVSRERSTSAILVMMDDDDDNDQVTASAGIVYISHIKVSCGGLW